LRYIIRILRLIEEGLPIVTVPFDNTWLWRADHTVKGSVYGGQNPVRTGIVINGDHVIAYGLASEHTLGNLVEWNGDNGQTFFY
jgi:hypothetical protein